MAGATIAMGPWSRGGGGGEAAPDPMRMMSEAMTLRNSQMEFMARQRAGSILAQNPDPEKATAALQADPLVGGYYPDAINLQRQMQLTKAQTQLEQARTQGELSGQARDAYADVIEGSAGAVNDPSRLVPSVMERLSKYPVSLQQQMMPSLELYLTSINSGLNLDKSSPTYQQDFQNYQARMLGKFVAIGKPDMLYQAMGLTAPAMHEKVPMPGGGTAPGYLGGAPYLYNPPPTSGEAGGVGAPTQVAGPGGVAGGGGGGVAGGGTATDPAASAVPGFRQAGPMTFSTAQDQQWQDLIKKQAVVNDNVSNGMALNQNINESRKLMTQFTTGPFTPLRMQAAAFAQGLGAHDDTVRLIAGGGNIPAYQEFSKLVYTQMMNQIMNNLPPGSRLNLQEYKDSIGANPRPDMLPGAIQHIFNYWQRQFIQNRMEQRFMTKYINDNQRVGSAAGQWDSHWQGLREKKNLLAPDYVTKDEKGGIPPEAIVKLLGNDDPQSRAAFDSKYGKGTAARYLDEDAE